ncbi:MULTISPECIES: sulfite exporter TauE/SafE family protein [unclassified Pseudodesulfovibrio]|uniref:sulfite exporter TauE/SafE family protein n=1 Tax=unclassified Pseudodesulfovibrio TaxID=2661612 RepID=UPI000FEBD758|nr:MULTISPECIES: sulfite exporter TauE/SafE family protein [unclassified Pseudodesulfovibrio]MCJ2165474.1 sulfite exporter TauE/SafE family protein [Pseudodesulfovibrio sp. S3-i]RWU03223.1 sulfite exporter TauE/SafE family protein [Pseudodesulfovibrio sp. S3]
MVRILTGLLVLLGAYFFYVFLRDYRANRHVQSPASAYKVAPIGLLTMFGDTLGIGNFAPATALLRFFKQIDDKKIPGTLNVFTSLPEVFSGCILITTIEVDPVTLISMLISSSVGAYFGASIISHFSVQKVRLTMGIALFVTAVVMFLGMMGWMPSGGDATGLTGINLIIAVVGNFILGILMTAGIGLYAPCMALIYFLGMSPRAAFPIMMGSCAFLMPIASLKFIKEGALDRKVALIYMLAGIPGVLIAAFVVKSLPLFMLKWVVIAVVLYTSGSMIYSMFKDRGEQASSKVVGLPESNVP